MTTNVAMACRLCKNRLAMIFERCCLSDPLPVNGAEFTTRGKEAKNRLLLIAQELLTPVFVSVSSLRCQAACLPTV